MSLHYDLTRKHTAVKHKRKKDHKKKKEKGKKQHRTSNQKSLLPPEKKKKREREKKTICWGKLLFTKDSLVKRKFVWTP